MLAVLGRNVTPGLTGAGLGLVALGDAFMGDQSAGEAAIDAGLITAPVLASIGGSTLGRHLSGAIGRLAPHELEGLQPDQSPPFKSPADLQRYEAVYRQAREHQARAGLASELEAFEQLKARYGRNRMIGAIAGGALTGIPAALGMMDQGGGAGAA